jgi:hypothetical protein
MIFGMLYSKLDKGLLCHLSRSQIRQLNNCQDLLYYYSKGVSKSLSFDYNNQQKRTLDFVNTNKVGNHIAEYKYSPSSSKPTIYASCYSCMIRSLYGDLDRLSDNEKKEWITYFNSFQSPDDGLFYDSVLANPIYNTEDWWGARHLALHLIIAYTALGFRPRYDLKFLEPFYEQSNVIDWLESRNWDDSRIANTGNEVMNYGCLLQYSRDFFSNNNAGKGLHVMMDWLEQKLNPDTGMWGGQPDDNPNQLSQIVQGAYHIYPLFFYDNRDLPYKEKAIDLLLKTQNSLGGFGVQLNSSACEDIDSIDPLIRFSKFTNYRKDEVDLALKRAFPVVLANMNDDGGFVFSRNKQFLYGHEEMYSGHNESSMFATWFRTLCLAYLVNYLGLKNSFCLKKIPGY